MDVGLGTRVAEAAYIAQQLSLAVPAVGLQRAIRALHREDERPPPAALATLRRRYTALLAQDVRNVRDGLYPRSLLFGVPMAAYARTVPRLAMELPRVASRRRRGDYRELPEHDSDRYPAYFRRTFHWQTDGYLSRRSAELYDVGVEFLFAGTADVMRRMVIPPISRHLTRTGGRSARLLDVACGTGRTLAQLHEAHPGLRLTGLDLSPFYLDEARARLSRVPDLTLVADNAERMPFRDALFDVVTSTYLFHELPRNARRRVVREMIRVLAPGGLLVLEDSAQPSESPEVGLFLERFPQDFHEPFYRDYLGDDLGALLEEEGLTVASVEPHFMAKVVVATRKEDA